MRPRAVGKVWSKILTKERSAKAQKYERNYVRETTNTCNGFPVVFWYMHIVPVQVAFLMDGKHSLKEAPRPQAGNQYLPATLATDLLGSQTQYVNWHVRYPILTPKVG